MMADVEGTMARPSYGNWARDADFANDLQTARTKKYGWRMLLFLTYSSVGVIYGDIGTSPLYVYATIFSRHNPSKLDVHQTTSLIIWAITLLVLIKYAFIVLTSNDNGEGGTFALYSLLCRACTIPTASGGHSVPSDQGLSSYSIPATDGAPAEDDKSLRRLNCLVHGNDGSRLRKAMRKSKWGQAVLLVLVLVLTSLVLADGILTPAVSVLSATSGLQVKTDISQSAVVGITCAILILLFAVQPLGTSKIGWMFSPVVLLWLASNVLIGVYNIAKYEGISILRCLSPALGIQYFQRDFHGAWRDLPGIFLAVTGCEALFADLGHFSVASIRVSFGAIAYPCLIVTYLGQASWLTQHTDLVSTTFYSSIPKPIFWPMFVLATAAAIVASQAMITGAFSILRQSIALGCFPRLRVVHTSADVEGQVYIPAANWLLMVLTVVVVAAFRDGIKLGNAYGIAINSVMVGTTLLLGMTLLAVRNIRLPLVLPLIVFFLLLESLFLSANLMNLHNGGWFTFMMAAVVASCSWVWYWGTSRKRKGLHSDYKSLAHVVSVKRDSPTGADGTRPILVRTSTQSPVTRINGVALVYSEDVFSVPKTFLQLLSCWGVHERVVFVTVRQVALPQVLPEERLLLMPLEIPGFFRCVARYGYMDEVVQDGQFVEQLLELMDTTSAALPALANTTPSTDGPLAAKADTLRIPAAPAIDAVLPASSSEAPAQAPPASATTQASSNYSITPAPTAANTIITAATPSPPAPAPLEVRISPSLPHPYVLAAGPVAFVLSRPIFRTSRNSGKGGAAAVRRVVHGVLVTWFASLWSYTARNWEQWEVPANTLFEVGTVCNL